MKVMESGRLAPSAHNDQPWEFILIKDKMILKKLEQFCISGRFVSQAGFAVVILTDKSSKWFQIDTTRAAQNMALTAWSLDLGTCWIGRIDREGLMSLLNIPSKWHVLTVLPFGYFNKGYVSKTKFRKSPKEVFHLIP
jgi:nitroreductase